MSSFCIFFVNSRYSDKTQRFYKNYTIVVLKVIQNFPRLKQRLFTMSLCQITYQKVS